jgi:hypothetical protein
VSVAVALAAAASAMTGRPRSALVTVRFGACPRPVSLTSGGVERTIPTGMGQRPWSIELDDLAGTLRLTPEATPGATGAVPEPITIRLPPHTGPLTLGLHCGQVRVQKLHQNSNRID